MVQPGSSVALQLALRGAFPISPEVYDVLVEAAVAAHVAGDVRARDHLLCNAYDVIAKAHALVPGDVCGQEGAVVNALRGML